MVHPHLDELQEATVTFSAAGLASRGVTQGQLSRHLEPDQCHCL